MADSITNKTTEQQKAQLSKRRGQAATQIVDPEERRKFISAQGDAEAANKGNLSVTKEKQLSQEAALKGYKNGTTRVPKTGPAVLHKDEAVLNKPEADAYRGTMSLVGAALAHKGDKEIDQPAKKSKKELKEIRTRKAKSGGYIHEHHHTVPMDHPMEEHTSPDQKAMLAHMSEHMPDESEAQDNTSEETTENAGM